MSGIGFNSIPGQGLVAPIFAFEVNSGGQYDSVSRLVLIGHKTPAGTLADNMPAVCASLEQADQLVGPGSMLREMVRIAMQNAPAQQIWIVPVAASGTAPTWTITVGTLPAGGGVGTIDIAGERIQITIAPGDTANAVATAIAAAISGYYNRLTGAMLQLTATSSTNVVTATARHASAIMAEIDVLAPTDVAGNLFAQAGVLTIANGAAGSGVPSLTAALAALGDDPAELIVSPWSDAASLDACQTMLNDTSGRWAWSRQSYGHVLTVRTAAIGDLTTLGLSRNDRHVSILPRFAGTYEASWLWASGFAAAMIPWLSDGVTGNVSRNQTGMVVQGLKAPRNANVVAAYATRNTLLGSGISTWKTTADGRVAIDKVITTYRTGPSGQPDTVFRDVQAMFQLMHALAYFRERLATKHGQKALADSNPGNLAAIATPKDIKATFIHAYDDLVQRGVLEDVDGFAKRLVVQRDTQQTNRVNVFAPLDRVNALDILAANATLHSQYRQAA